LRQICSLIANGRFRRWVQLVTATPLVVYRREFRIPRSCDGWPIGGGVVQKYLRVKVRHVSAGQSSPGTGPAHRNDPERGTQEQINDSK